jgi:hypothetical protein
VNRKRTPLAKSAKNVTAVGHWKSGTRHSFAHNPCDSKVFAVDIILYYRQLNNLSLAGRLAAPTALSWREI